MRTPDAKSKCVIQSQGDVQKLVLQNAVAVQNIKLYDLSSRLEVLLGYADVELFVIVEQRRPLLC